MIKFTHWLLNEIKFDDLEETNGRESSQEKMLALYILYYQAYSSEGLDPWNYSDWIGGRASKWTFLGTLPRSPDLIILDKILLQHNGDSQSAANEVLSGPNKSMMAYAGGVSYRNTDQGRSYKITSSWGANPISKMRAAADLIKKANESNPPKEIFTAADERLKELIQKAEDKMPALHKKGIVSVSSLGLSTPPKSLVPILYKAITNMSGASGNSTWNGFDSETGALKMHLHGTGDVKKFVFGNKALWKNSLTRELQKTGYLDKILKAKEIIDGGGILGFGAKQVVLLAMNNALGNMAGDTSLKIDEDGLMWILKQID